eukprot:m.127788 g.127788  ORF g.127788 m.127788 type:complete len:922 (-) comp15663_c5_seq1:148-2913(-)
MTMGNRESTALTPLPSSPPVGKTQSVSARPVRQQFYEDAGRAPRPNSVMPVAPQSIYIQRDSSGSLAFSFSTARKTIHYVGSVDPGGPAEKAGLQVGHHIVAVNGHIVTHVVHERVVTLLQAAAKSNRPLQLKVLPCNERIRRYLRHSNRSSVGPASPVNGIPMNAWGPSSSVEAFTREFCALVHNPQTNKFLCVVKPNEGYDIIRSNVKDGSFEDALHSFMIREFNLPAHIKGLLRVELSEHSFCIVFLVHTTASGVTLQNESLYTQAAWKSLSELSSLQQQGRPPWSTGTLGLQTTKLLDWANYVNSGALVAPLHMLAERSDPVWHEKLGGKSEAEQRETRRRASFTLIQKHMNSPSSAAAHRQQPLAAPRPQAATRSTSSPAIPSSTERAAPADLRIRSGSVLLNIPPPPPELEEPRTPAKALEPVAEESSIANDRDYDAELYATQCEEMEKSIAQQRVRAFYVPKESASSFGMQVEKQPELGAGASLSTTEAIRVKSLDSKGAVAQHGGVQVGDRVLKINGQWVANVDHAEYLLQVLADEQALDITITRGEPLPPATTDLTTMSDQELQDAAFDHLGLRLLVHPTEGTPRDDVIQTLSARFGPSRLEPSSQREESKPQPSNLDVEIDVSEPGPLEFVMPPPPVLDEASSQVLSPSQSESDTMSLSLSTSSTGDLKSSLKRGSKSNKKSVSFRSELSDTELTWSKFDYHRPLDPGRGFSDLRALFNYNTDRMEQEQLREAEEYVETRRLYGHYIVRKKTTRPFGFKLRPIPKDLSLPFMYLEGVEIVDIDPTGPLAEHGGVKEGDRLVKVNGQWVLNHQHAEYLVFEVLRRAKALDLTITRNEPLAPSFDLNSKSDEELLDLAFEHGGYRVAIAEGQCSRDDVLLMIRKRLAASTTPALSNLDAKASSDTQDLDDEEC